MKHMCLHDRLKSITRVDVEYRCWVLHIETLPDPRVEFISQVHSSQIFIKLQFQNFDQALTSKYWPNFSLKILPEIRLQNLDLKPCAQSLNKILALWPNLSFQICNKLLPTRSLSSTSSTVTTSTSFQLASLHTRVASIKFAKRYGVWRPLPAEERLHNHLEMVWLIHTI